MSAQDFLKIGTFVGRVWREDVQGPSVVVIRNGQVIDITSTVVPTMRDLLEMGDPAAYVAQSVGEPIADISNLLNKGSDGRVHLLAPIDLQSVKACGVTFARSMIERVIEERAAGNPELAARIRGRIAAVIGESIRDLKAGSAAAEQVKTALIDEGVWSQYLEVGIGPDAEVFSKAQVLSSVGHGAEVGLHPASKWNNPEPEVVLAVNSQGRIVGATLGNDVNLRDIEGRSALLLGKAKDNNASCSIGPLLRLFDETYDLDDVRTAELTLTVEGDDGFLLRGHSSMKEISRDPLDLVAQTIGPHHQYPDGLVLFMGTLFAPTEDRGQLGQGFTHHVGDVVSISNSELGTLRNTVRLSTECPPWVFGASHLMRNLAERGLL
ncbi:fumarylacetoacetate hydrolase [Ochrobactrum sp. MYb15]|uniref:fumarylacetoacetate hydrolase family protein n=1 Tax=Brucella pituitosa TaxID=571256 RepID=UPI000CFDBE77|nr:fumarylacetoacetate hydrolase [Ochrobactrum sp. MYb19]PRA63383.1 fumarylacetoacetate hydrolase [Ochrobactrum sp. MYb18]PRA73262.1 fumarylacetoacetate hydrolase [Brucella thiophenivorans]PRA88377.1 fumarylacetoacetate hydrolase [Ochrobactrum sp. MYb14]PRA94785.1 fumarylacetoacetate hydrolase [Ochrobactrum sp. MYb15]